MEGSGSKRALKKLKTEAKRLKTEAKTEVNVHELKTDILRKVFVESTGEVVIRIFSDAKSQTEEKKEQEKEEGEEERETKGNELEVRLTRCPVCLTLFSSENKLMIPDCGHGLCQLCLNVLFDRATTAAAAAAAVAAVRCPLCRNERKKADYILVKFYHLESICLAERSILIKNLESLKNKNIQKVLNCVNELLEIEKKSQKNLPLVCNRKSLEKRRLELLHFVDTETKIKKLVEARSCISDAVLNAEESLNVVTSPNENLLFDISTFFAKRLIKRINERPMDGQPITKQSLL